MNLVFHASAGPLDENGEVIPYGIAVQNITLKKPFLSMEVKVNDKSGETIASAGSDLNLAINWQNTLPDKIYNAVIEAKLNSPIIDQHTISATKGFYRGFDQVLVWNQSSYPDLAEIDPLATGEALFKFSVLDSLSNSVIKQGNPVISIDIKISGERVTQDQGRIQVTNHLTKEIKIATLFQLSRRGLYYSGPFKNSGPLPPKVGKETTYTVVWSLTNTSNNVSDATVSAFLPSYVKWLGVINPENANISYDQSTGQIVWQAGTVSAGSGDYCASAGIGVSNFFYAQRFSNGKPAGFGFRSRSRRQRYVYRHLFPRRKTGTYHFS